MGSLLGFTEGVLTIAHVTPNVATTGIVGHIFGSKKEGGLR